MTKKQSRKQRKMNFFKEALLYGFPSEAVHLDKKKNEYILKCDYVVDDSATDFFNDKPRLSDYRYKKLDNRKLCYFINK